MEYYSRTRSDAPSATETTFEALFTQDITFIVEENNFINSLFAHIH